MYEEKQGGRRYPFKTKEGRMSQYFDDKAIREEIFRNKLPFITPGFLPHFFLCQGLVVVGGESGRAKSTTCANVVSGFLEYTSSEKTCLVVSNEENSDAIYERIACNNLRLNYIDVFSGKAPEHHMQMVQDEVMSIADRVEVVTNEEGWDMGVYEDVRAVLTSAAEAGVNMVLIDYLQTITHSRDNPQMTQFEVSKALGLYLKNYGRINAVPVVVFVQLNPESTAATMGARVQYDKTFFNHGFICVEIKPNFDNRTTTFKVHKDRFMGHTNKEVVMSFNGGKYELGGGI